MQLRSTADRYGHITRALHWIIVVGIIAQYFLAEAGESERNSTTAMSPMDWHVSIGLTLLALAVVRVLWRAVDRTPDWPAQMPRYEKILARAVHVGLYALLFAIPISGWLLSSFEGESVRLFGWLDLPSLATTNQAREHLLEDVHEALFNVLFALAVLHVIAALKHHFVDRDSVLRRMLPGGH